MRKHGNRRTFLKTTTLAAGTALGFPYIARGAEKKKLRAAIVGVGGRGGHGMRIVQNEEIVALCDVDAARMSGAKKKFPKAAIYRDYREMFEGTGFELKVCRERVDERSLNAIQSGALVVSEEFSGYSPTELAVDYMWIAALKPCLTNSIGGLKNAGELPVAAV